MGIIKINKLGEPTIFEAKDKELKYDTTKNNPKWQEFKEYCHSKSITGFKQVKNPPDWLKDMMKDRMWKRKMKDYFAY